MEDEHCSLRITRRLAATADEVWSALVDEAARDRWLGAIGSEVREVEPGRVVEVAFPDSVARLEVRPDAGSTLLVVDHRGIPAPHGMRAMRWWMPVLTRLEAAL